MLAGARGSSSLRVLEARRGGGAWRVELVRVVAPEGADADEVPTALALTGELAAVGGRSGGVRLVAVGAADAGAVRARLGALRGRAIAALAFAADGSALAAADDAGRLAVFSARAGGGGSVGSGGGGSASGGWTAIASITLLPAPQAAVQLGFAPTPTAGEQEREQGRERSTDADAGAGGPPPLLVSTREFAAVVRVCVRTVAGEQRGRRSQVEVEVARVGTKVRNAALGAIFHADAAAAALGGARVEAGSAGDDAPALLAARPGRRLWSASASGRVLGTLKLGTPEAAPALAFGTLHALGPLILTAAESGVAVLDTASGRALQVLGVQAAAAASAPEMGLAYVLGSDGAGADAAVTSDTDADADGSALWVISGPCTSAEYVHAARAAGAHDLADSAEARMHAGAAAAVASHVAPRSPPRPLTPAPPPQRDAEIEAPGVSPARAERGGVVAAGDEGGVASTSAAHGTRVSGGGGGISSGAEAACVQVDSEKSEQSPPQEQRENQQRRSDEIERSRPTAQVLRSRQGGTSASAGRGNADGEGEEATSLPQVDALAEPELLAPRKKTQKKKRKKARVADISAKPEIPSAAPAVLASSTSAVCAAAGTGVAEQDAAGTEAVQAQLGAPHAEEEESCGIMPPPAPTREELDEMDRRRREETELCENREHDNGHEAWPLPSPDSVGADGGINGHAHESGAEDRVGDDARAGGRGGQDARGLDLSVDDVSQSTGATAHGEAEAEIEADGYKGQESPPFEWRLDDSAFEAATELALEGDTHVPLADLLVPPEAGEGASGAHSPPAEHVAGFFALALRVRPALSAKRCTRLAVLASRAGVATLGARAVAAALGAPGSIAALEELEARGGAAADAASADATRAAERWKYNPKIVDGEAQPRFGVRTVIEFQIGSE